LAIRVDLATDLAAQILNASGQVCSVARGASMLPAVFPGDTLEIHRRHFGQIRTGDVVLATNQGHLCTHRVAREEIRCGRRVFITRGDAVPREDEQPISEDEFLGRVEFVVRRGRRLRPEMSGNWFHCALRAILTRSSCAKSFVVRVNFLQNLLANNFGARPLTIDETVARHS
jgi:signal peptidase I